MLFGGNDILLHTYFLYLKVSDNSASVSKISRVFGINRKSQQGGALIMAMMLTTILLILGAAYLLSLQTERRFSGVQERSLQAWYLAKSGCDYFLYYCQEASATSLIGAPGNTLQEAQKTASGALLLAKVPVLHDSEHYYFEISRLSAKVIEVNGIVKGTLSSSGKPTCFETKLYIVSNSAGGWKNAIYEKRPSL